MQQIKLYIFILREIFANYIGYKLRLRFLFNRSKINNMSRSPDIDVIDKGIKHKENILNHIQDHNLEIKNKSNFLEMGPGGSALHGIHKILEGWHTYIGVDSFPSQIWSEYPQQLYKKFIEGQSLDIQSKIKNIISSSRDNKGPIYYYGNDGLNNKNFNSKFKDGSIDFIYTWGVLEHIENPKEVFKKNYELLSDSGYILHVIDPHPHIWDRFPEPYIFLTIPLWLWNLMYQGRGFINRIRASSYERWAEEAGFKIISNKKEISKFDISKFQKKVSKEISYTDLDDLKTDRLYLLLRK